jgi:hypothetical protein
MAPRASAHGRARDARAESIAPVRSATNARLDNPYSRPPREFMVACLGVPQKRASRAQLPTLAQDAVAGKPQEPLRVTRRGKRVGQHRSARERDRGDQDAVPLGEQNPARRRLRVPP